MHDHGGLHGSAYMYTEHPCIKQAGGCVYMTKVISKHTAFQLLNVPMSIGFQGWSKQSTTPLLLPAD